MRSPIAPALAEALKSFFAENDLPKRVRLGVANQRIVVRSLDLPPLEDPKAARRRGRAPQAPDHIPMPMDEAILDYVPLGQVQTLNGPRMRVVIVAARRELIDRLVGATKDAGLKVEGIDLAAFGMVRALAPKEQDEQRRALRERRRPHQRRRGQPRPAACSRVPPPAG